MLLDFCHKHFMLLPSSASLTSFVFSRKSNCFLLFLVEVFFDSLGDLPKAVFFVQVEDSQQFASVEVEDELSNTMFTVPF